MPVKIVNSILITELQVFFSTPSFQVKLRKLIFFFLKKEAFVIGQLKTR